MKLKQKIKNFFIAHPMDDKSKGRIQGIALGFGVCAVGFLVMCLAIGCAPRDDESEQSLSGQAQRHNLFGAGTSGAYSLPAGYYTFNENPSVTSSGFCGPVVYEGISYDYVCMFTSERVGIYLCDRAWTTYYQLYDGSSSQWVVSSRTIYFPNDIITDRIYDISWIRDNSVYSSTEPEISSSSSEASSSDSSSESSDSSSEIPTGSLDDGFSVTLSETTAFSAWAKNPANNDYAVNYDSNAPFVLYTGSSSGETNTYITSAYNTYFVGEFSIHGVPDRSFDTIGLVTLNLSVDNSFCLNGDSEAVQVSDDMYKKGAFIISECYYVDSTTDTRLLVFSMGSQRATLNGSEITALVGPTWANQGFRNLDFVDGSRLIDVNGLSASTMFQMENNSLSSSSATSAWVLGNSSTGVFGLIASAFGAIGGILGIALIPGLTIGTLLFVPLVVTIVLAIIKMMGK